MSEFFYLLVSLCFRRQLNLLRTIPALNCILIAEDLSSILVTWFQRHTMKINQKDFVSDLRELPLMNRFGELRKQHFQVPSKGSEGKGGLTWAEKQHTAQPAPAAKTPRVCRVLDLSLPPCCCWCSGSSYCSPWSPTSQTVSISASTWLTNSAFTLKTTFSYIPYLHFFNVLKCLSLVTVKRDQCLLFLFYS